MFFSVRFNFTSLGGLLISRNASGSKVSPKAIVKNTRSWLERETVDRIPQFRCGDCWAPPQYRPKETRYNLGPSNHIWFELQLFLPSIHLPQYQNYVELFFDEFVLLSSSKRIPRFQFHQNCLHQRSSSMTEEYQIQEHNSAFSLCLSLSLVSHSLVRFLYISFLGILLYIIRKKSIKVLIFWEVGRKKLFPFFVWGGEFRPYQGWVWDLYLR